MNLCLTCREFVPGGIARSTGDLAEALATEGHSVHVITGVSDTPAPVLRGVAIRTVPVPPAPRRRAGPDPGSAPLDLMHAAAVYREVRRIHERERPVDAVLAPLWRSEGAVCALDERFPTVVSCMTSLRTISELDGRYQEVAEVDELLALERGALERSRYLHGLTESVLRKTIADFHLHPQATAVIGRGLRDRGRSTKAKADDGRVVRVLFVGRLERRKGVDNLLAAARELIEDGVAVEFTLAGANADPSFRASFEREAMGRPALSEAVHFAGLVSDTQLHSLYADCDIVCVPSRYESHGVVLIEAMMFGKPIVTCDAGGIGEVVSDEDSALLSPPDDPHALAESLRRVAASADLRAELGARGRVNYEQRFDAGAVARQMVSFLEHVIGIHHAAASDVAGRLGTLLADELALAPEDARTLAGELLDPPAPAWWAWAQERQSACAEESTLLFLHRRHETLCRIEQGGWWRLRGRLLPLLSLAARLRARVLGHDS
jgi:glycogen synthase